MRAKRYKHSLRSNDLKQSLRPFGLKRKFFKNIPELLLFFILISFFGFFIFFFSNLILTRQNSFLSPLAQVKSGKDESVESLLHKNSIQFTRVEKDTVYLKDQGIVYLDSHKSLAPQISSLQLILSRLTIEGKKFKKLDLRFERPIIEF